MRVDISEFLPYNFAESERKWFSIFEKKPSELGDKANEKRKKYYVLEMFPYPSGRIHMGHVRNYTFGDIIARYKRLNRFDVLHPIGWDAFGLPAENAALERKVHPKEWTYSNIENMKYQLKKLGLSYDWDLEFATCDEDYYAYQQKLFLALYKRRYIYKKLSTVNWDPVDNCVLANEQVINGRGWRSGALVERRELKQWFLRITDFADELLEGLDELKGWPEKVRMMQENWIGKSNGLVIKFKTSHGDVLDVFSTRADTIYGASFIAISADHAIAKAAAEKDAKIKAFADECKQGATNLEFIAKLEKKGIDTGVTAINPMTQEKIPVYIANFVLAEYGCGAIFGCPAHDQRDYDFAVKYNLPIKTVVQGSSDAIPYTEDGIAINSDVLNGLTSAEAREKVAQILEERNEAVKTTSYRLRDWGLSRQRYWGCPIPIVQCPHCGDVACSDDMLPVLLPDDVTFDQVGNPLDRHPSWRQVKCPKCGADALRDTDTMDTFVDSSWYFIRFAQKKCLDEKIKAESIDKWLPVDQYVGGIEHAILHLLYARFFTRVLSEEFGFSVKEPFKNLLTQGMVGHVTYKKADGSWVYPDDVDMLSDGRCIESKTGEDVIVGRAEKMSKSKKNVVDPDKIIGSYGADAVRLFVVSDTPPEKDFEWSIDGLEGCWRFINRLWRLFAYAEQIGAHLTALNINEINCDKSLVTDFHKAIRNITDALESNSFNRAVAYIRDLVNKIYDKFEDIDPVSLSQILGHLAVILSPFVPFFAEEAWSAIAEQGLACEQDWPAYNDEYIKADTVTVAVQVNGKLRSTIEITVDATDEEAFAKATDNEKVRPYLEGKEIRKKIYIKSKIVNFVV